jgi:uncharacterized protein (DUF1499 family)
MKVALTCVLAAIVLVLLRRPVLEAVFRIGDVAALDFAELKLTTKPNQYLVCPETFCSEKPHRIGPVFSDSVDVLKERWAKLLRYESNLAVVIENPGSNQRTYVQRTPLLRFPDLITVRFLGLEGGRSTVAIYSRSLYGHSDLGANKKRIDAWLGRL